MNELHSLADPAQEDGAGPALLTGAYALAGLGVEQFADLVALDNDAEQPLAVGRIIFSKGADGTGRVLSQGRGGDQT